MQVDPRTRRVAALFRGQSILKKSSPKTKLATAAAAACVALYTGNAHAAVGTANCVYSATVEDAASGGLFISSNFSAAGTASPSYKFPGFGMFDFNAASLGFNGNPITSLNSISLSLVEFPGTAYPVGTTTGTVNFYFTQDLSTPISPGSPAPSFTYDDNNSPSGLDVGPVGSADYALSTITYVGSLAYQNVSGQVDTLTLDLNSLTTSDKNFIINQVNTSGLLRFVATQTDNTNAARYDGNFTATPSKLTLDGTTSYTPKNLVWAGSSGSAWDTGTTSDFTNTATNASTTFSTYDGVTFSSPGGGTVAVAAGGVFASTFIVNSSGTFTFAGGGIGTGGGINKQGSGAMILANTSNTYTGPTVISAGTLAAGADDVLSHSSPITLASGATLDIHGYTAQTGAITITGGTLETGSGTIIPTAVTVNSAPSVISGNLNASTISSTSTFFLNIGSLSGQKTLELSANLSGSRAFAMTGSGTVGLDGNNSGLTGNFTTQSGNSTSLTLLLGNNTVFGSGVVFMGNGTLIASSNLSGANAFTNGISASGTTNFSGANPIEFGTNGNTFVSGSTALWNVGSLTNLTVSAPVQDGTSSSFNLAKGGAGTLTLTNSANIQTGSLTLSGGTLVFSSAATDPYLNTVLLDGTGTFSPNLVLQNGSALSTSTPIVILPGTKNPSINVNGGGITAANQSVGTFTITGSVASTGSVTVNVVNPIDSLVLTDGITDNVASVSGVRIVKAGAGSLIIQGTQSYAPGSALTINGGTVQFANSIAGNNLPVTIANAPGAALDLNNFNNKVASLYGGGTLGGIVQLGSASLTAGGDNTSGVFAGSMIGSGGFNKVGTGTMTLAGSNAYAGATSVNGGTLVADLTSQASVLNSASQVSLGGAALQVKGTVSTARAQTVSGLSLTTGANVVDVNAINATTTLDLRGPGGTLGITRSPGATVDFKATTGTLGTNALVYTGNANDASGILGAWATVNNGAALASVDGTGKIVAYTGYLSLNALGANTVPNGTSNNLQINALGTSGSVSISSPTTNINTLTQAFTTASTLDLSPGTLTTNALFITPNGAALTVGGSPNSGVLTAGGVSNANNELILANNSSGSSLTVNSTISNNGAGSVAVTIPGSGTTLLSGANSFTGPLSISNGVVVVSSIANGGTNSALGASSNSAANLLLGGGATLRYTGPAASSDRAITLISSNSTAGVTLDASGSGSLNLTNSGSLSYGAVDQPRTLTLSGTSAAANTLDAVIGDNGAGKFSLNKTGSGVWVLGSANSFSGATTVTAGTLRAGADSAFPSSSVVTVATGGTLDLGGFSEAPGTINLNGGVVNLNGGTLTSLAANVTTASGSSTPSSIGGAGTFLVNSPTTVTLTHNNGSLTTVDLNLGAKLYGTGSLTFLGGGTVNLGATDNSNFSGPIQAGTVSILASGANALGSNGTLILNGGTFIPTANQLTFNDSISLAANSGIGAANTTVTFSGGSVATTTSGAASLTVTGAAIFSDPVTNAFANTFTSIVKAGAGTLILQGSNTNSGTFGVASGTLVLAAGSANSKLGGISITGTGTTNSTLLIQGTGVLNSKVAISSSIGTATSASAIIVNGGTVAIGAFNSSGSFGASSGGTIFNIVNASDALTFNGIVTDAGTLSGVATGDPFSKIGSGLLAFSGPLQNYTQGAVFTVNGGTAQFNSFAGPNLNVTLANTAGVVLDLNNVNNTFGSIYGGGSTGGNIRLGSALLTVGGDNTTGTFAGSLIGTASSAGLVKVGSGTLTLSGSSSYTGPTTVNGGTLVADTTTNATVLNSSTTLSLGGGAFQLKGKAASTATQVVSGLNLTTGANVVDVNNLGTTTTIDLRGPGATLGITRSVGSTVDFKATTGTLGTNALVYTNNTDDASGILGTWATVNGGTDFASVDGTGKIVAYTGYTTLNALGANTVPSGVNSNIKIAALGTSGNVPISSGSTSINTLMQGFTTSSTLDLSPGTLSANGLIIAPGKAALTIGTAANSGVLTAGGASNAANELILANNNSATLLTVNSTIADNATGTVSLVLPGSGTTVLNGANTFTGPITETGNTLVVSNLANGGSASAIGAASSAASNLLLGNGAVLRYTGSGSSSDRLFTINGTAPNASVTLDASGTGSLNLTNTGTIGLGIINQPRSLTLTGTNAGTLTAAITDNGTTVTSQTSLTKSGAGSWNLAGANTYTGPTTVSAGILGAGTNNGLSPFSATTINQAQISLNGFAEAFTGALNLNRGTISLGGGTLSFGTLNVSTSASNSAGNTLTGAGAIAINSASTIAVTHAGTATTDLDINAKFTGSSNLTFSGSGSVNLELDNSSYLGSISNSSITLNLFNANALGSNQFNFNSGTLIAAGAPYTLANSLSIGGSINFAGTNAITFSNPASTISGFNSSANVLTVANTTTFAEPIVNVGFNITSFVKAGTGSLILTGANLSTGTFGVSGGTLQFAATTTNPGLSGVSVISSGATSPTLAFLGSNVVNSGLALTSTLGTTGVNGTVFVSGASLSIGAFTAGGTFGPTASTIFNVVGGSDELALTGALVNSGTLINVTTVGSIGSAIVKTGAGTLLISGTQTQATGATLAVNGGNVEMDSDAGNGAAGKLGITLAANTALYTTVGQNLATLSSSGTANFPTGATVFSGSVTGAGTIAVGSTSSLIASSTFNQGVLSNAGLVTIAGPTSTLNTVTGAGTIAVGSASTVSIANRITQGVLANAGSVAVSSGASTIGIVNGPGTLSVTGTTSLTANSIAQRNLSVGSASTVAIAFDNQAHTGGTPIGTSVVSTLNLNSNGTLNLTNNGIVILDTTSLGAVQSLITQAADVTSGTPKWDMPGITSSSAAADPGGHAVGYALASALPNGGSTSFNGVTFSDAVIARYTLVGDTGLKGTVDLSDYTKVVLNLGKSNAVWSDGNFDYSGNVNLGDYTKVILNIGRSDGQSSVFNATGPSAQQVKASALTLHTTPAVAQASTATDVTLLVNPTNGRVTLVNALQTGQAVITAYTINSPSQSLLPFSADGGGKYLANALENNPSVFYKASNGLTYNLWTGIKNVSTFIGEGFSNHYNANVDSTWTNYTLATTGYALGTLFKRLSSGGTKDLVFQWEDANLNTYTSVVTYVGAVPEPGSVSLIAAGAMAMLGRRRRSRSVDKSEAK